VTRGSQPVAGPVVSPHGSTLWGFGRTVAVEHAELWGGLIDIDPGETPAASGAAVAHEALDPDAEDQVAYRGGARHVLRLAPRTASPGEPPPVTFRPDGAYLITGGMGGLGLEVAQWMVRHAARRLILVGRTPLPPRDTWTAEAPGPLAGQIRAVRALEALGASVHLASVDVADEQQLRVFLDRYRQEGWPPIRGVVHAAGVMQYEPLNSHDAAAMRRVLAPKVRGGWLLHRLLSDAPLDFFVLFSSASAVLSSPMLASYAAANSFLDGLAHYRRGRGQPALAINWGLWSSVGMAARFDGASRAPSPIGRMISPEQGLDALSRLVGEDATQAAVVPVDWNEWGRLYPAFMEAPLLTHLFDNPAASPTGAADPGLSPLARILEAAPFERAPLVSEYLVATVGAVLGLAPELATSRQPLTAMGLDSLMAVELKNRLERDLAVRLPIVQFLQGPTVEELGALVVEQIAAVPENRPVPAAAAGAATDRAPAAEAPPVEALSDDEVDAMLQSLLAEDGGR
jgi:NAD(P)-dependent dehydrogenase (short-subunit alcohol dehydrogenase family)/acyl carrier protein